MKPQQAAAYFPPARLPELLAPAGSPEAFHAAIAAGADAVYLGGKRFGARQYAGNFDEADIEAVVAFAHARGVKVYVTVNTLIHDRELRSALEYLLRLYAMGVDAVLVQDLGLASLVRAIIPGLSLHASTQMTIHNTEGVRAMAAMGFSRVVLARELPLEEIEAIAKETTMTGIGLEVFAHGALCFSYSGHCLLSSVIGGRSGNRGMCAQPCRRPYTLVTGTTDSLGRPGDLHDIASAGEYLLSPKDLCVYRKLDRLARSPVVSLKIEGRMKSPGYVAIVTSVYRRALDAIARGTGFSSESDESDLALAFNRGFTDGYLFTKRHSAVMGIDRPDNRGLRIGTVEQYRPETREAVITLVTGRSLVAGDGLFIASPGGKGKGIGFPLNAPPQRSADRVILPIPGCVRAGADVFLTSSVALAAQERRIIAGEYPELRHPVPLDCTVTVDTKGTVLIEGTAGTAAVRKVAFRYSPDFPLTPARTRPLTPESLRENLGKTGGTQFTIRTAEIRYGGGLFAPVSAINRMRRELLACAEAALIAASRPVEAEIRAAADRLAAMEDPGPVPADHRENREPLLVVITDTLPAVLAAVESGCDIICFEPCIPDLTAHCRCSSDDEDPRDLILAAIRACRGAEIRFVWKLPRIIRDAALDTILTILPGLAAEGLSACMAGDTGAINALHSRCPDLAIIGSPEMNVFNNATARFAATRCHAVMLSPELSGAEITELVRRTRAGGCTITFGTIVQGDLEVMISENCVPEPVNRCGRAGAAGQDFIGLRDGTGRIFPVRTDRNCRTRILNADETCLIDQLPEIIDAGIEWVCIDARRKKPEYIRAIVRIYREGIARTSRTPARGISPELAALREQVRRIAPGRITSGHFIRGLKEA